MASSVEYVLHFRIEFDCPHQTVAHVEAGTARCRLPSVSARLLARARRLCDGSPASEALRVPARRSGPLSLMPRLMREAVWQHKTNNATTQPSLLLTEMQPTALFRPLRLHSAPRSRPSKRPLTPHTPPVSLPAPTCADPPKLFLFCCCMRQLFTLKPTQP